jgi:two-component sensor histidine kinase
VRFHIVGDAGALPAVVTTPLAVVLSELLQNAVEHAFGERSGELVVTARRAVGRLHVSVEDDGVGLPPGLDPDASTSLGLSIVRTLVESELDGQLVVGAGAAGRGTRVEFDVPLR